MAIRPSGPSNFDQLFNQVEEEYMPPIIDAVRARASMAGPDEPEYQSIIRAFEGYFGPAATRPERWWVKLGRVLHDNLFLVVAVVMALAFAVFGTLDKENAKAYLDIAKIFAGAIVGSAANSGMASMRVARARKNSTTAP